MTLTSSERSTISRRTWRSRKHEGGKGRDPVTGTPIFAGGVTHGGKLYHKVTADVLAQAHRIGLRGQQAQRYAAELLTNPQAEVQELLATIDNYEGFYNRKMMIWRNLYSKVNRGTFDATKAPKLFAYLTDSVNRYMKAESYGSFDKETRDAANRALAQDFIDSLPEIRSGQIGLEVKTPQFERSRTTGKWYNPRSAPGKSTRPPAAWMAHMLPRIKAGYPRRSAESISRITAGIWHKYPHSTQDRLITQYEGMPRNPGARWHLYKAMDARAISQRAAATNDTIDSIYYSGVDAAHVDSVRTSDKLGIPNPPRRALMPLVVLGAALLGLWWWSKR